LPGVGPTRGIYGNNTFESGSLMTVRLGSKVHPCLEGNRGKWFKDTEIHGGVTLSKPRLDAYMIYYVIINILLLYTHKVIDGSNYI
jgi:hypothetical protein